jgi:Tfp pilus assembly protein PilO
MRIQDLYRNITSRWVLLIFATWLVLILTAGTILLLYAGTGSMNRQKEQLNNEIALLSAKKDRVESSMNELNMEDKKLSAILSDLLSASKKSGALLGETSIAELSKEETFKSLPLNISVKGNYNQVGKFINILEKNMCFRINEIKLSTKEKKLKGIICTIKAEFISL